MPPKRKDAETTTAAQPEAKKQKGGPNRVLERRAFVAEAVHCYAPHSFSVQTSKERLTLAKHVHVIGQLVSHSGPLLGQLVHGNFLAPVSYRVLERRAFVAEAVRCYAPHSFSVQTSKESKPSKACPCHWATCEPLEIK